MSVNLTDSNGAHFEHYFDLLIELCPMLTSMMVFNSDLDLIWQDKENKTNPFQVKQMLRDFAAHDESRSIADLNDEAQFELVKVENAEGTVLILCLGYAWQDPMRKVVTDQQRIKLLNRFLAADYEQNQTLVARENELNSMTDELTQRYEELNLIYKAEDQALNIHHGRELLNQLTINTRRFLNVDAIYLYIEGKNVAQHKFKNDNPVYRAENLFSSLRESVMPMLEETHQAIVVNCAEEASQFGLVPELPFKMVASPVYDAESAVVGLLAIANQNTSVDFTNSDRNLLDVMAKKASKIAQTHFDPLTGLENNNSFELVLKDLLRQTRGTSAQHAIANIDIDRMAVINDISGRDAGDLLIKKVGQKLASMVRSRDVVARLGSDKFGVMLENCDLHTAQTVMRKISHAISSIDMEWEGNSHDVSVSIGIAPISAQSQSVTALLNAAETARNVSKERGRNFIHVLEMEDSSLLRRKDQIRWVNRIQSALRDDRFRLYAQLIHPLKPGSDKPHFEVLLRMEDEEGSLVAPERYITAAENFYLMSSIDYWVVNRTFEELARFRQPAGLSCQISVNLSGQSLSDTDSFAAFIENKFEHSGIDPGDICFEITESAAIANIEEAQVFIDQVHALGCKFSLDDFGTGLSSFAYLKNLKVDYLKIDGSFVRDVVKDPVCESMVSAINQVGQAMKLKTVAEFVENEEIARKLKLIGVDFGQGFGLGVPAPLDDTLANLANPKSRSA